MLHLRVAQRWRTGLAGGTVVEDRACGWRSSGGPDLLGRSLPAGANPASACEHLHCNILFFQSLCSSFEKLNVC